PKPTSAGNCRTCTARSSIQAPNSVTCGPRAPLSVSTDPAPPPNSGASPPVSMRSMLPGCRRFPLSIQAGAAAPSPPTPSSGPALPAPAAATTSPATSTSETASSAAWPEMFQMLPDLHGVGGLEALMSELESVREWPAASATGRGLVPLPRTGLREVPHIGFASLEDQRRAEEAFLSLSAREVTVLAYLSFGLSAKEVAITLNVS